MSMFAKIIVPLPLPELYTYSVPDEMQDAARAGMRVTVQFGAKKIITGVIYELLHNTSVQYQIKPIIEILDDKPIVSDVQFSFWTWIQQYYMCTMGEVYKAAMPSGLKLESETKLLCNPVFSGSLTSTEGLAFDILQHHQGLTIKELSSALKLKSVQNLVKNLQNKKAVFLQEKIKESYKPRLLKYVKLNDKLQTDTQLHEVLDELAHAPKQLALMLAYIELSGSLSRKEYSWVPQQKILDKAKASSAALKMLVQKSYMQVSEKEVSRLVNTDNTQTIQKVLTPAQEAAYSEITKIFKVNNVCLLHGVTSSGKTEIYIELIKQQLANNKQVLYLLPEIALTSQIINRLKLVFGKAAGVYHSKFSDNERVEIYNNLLNSTSYSLILGVRSSVFLPFNNLGLIIVDEEHENTYKQYDPAPRYNARDAAVVLARLHDASVLLGSATPSLESYYNVKTGKYGLVELNTRYADIQLPEIKVVDVREAYRKKKMQTNFSPFLIDKIQEALDNKEQIILFQNRRGYSPYIQCNICGWIPTCNACDVSLTYHKHFNNISCHYCGQTHALPSKCKACGNSGLSMKGFGTEKVEDMVATLFPEARVARMDQDTTRTRKAYENVIGRFEKHGLDILIGTQMVSKGLDFDKVSVVGILNADNMLSYPDFRAYERSYQLMAQVSGRAGRKKKRGLVIIQTFDPANPVITDVVENNYAHMFYQQIHERKMFKYPPHHRLIKCIIKHRDKALLSKGAAMFAAELRTFLGDRVIGPEYPLINRIQHFYIKHIFIKIEKTYSVKKVKERMAEKISKVKTNEALRALVIISDVDPM